MTTTDEPSGNSGKLAPRVWMNKRGELFAVVPYYTLIETPAMLELDYENTKLYYGTVIHAGWLVQNSHGISIVLPLNINKYFEDLGEL